MECVYYNPKIQILLSSRRVATCWKTSRVYKDPFWRFYWIPDTPTRIRYDNTEYFLDANNYAVIAPETDYHPVGSSTCEQLYIHFQIGESYSAYAPGIHTGMLSGSMKETIDRICECMKKDGQQPSRQQSLLINSLCIQALLDLPESMSPRDYADQRVCWVLDYIYEHYTEPVTNARLARIMHMNENAFIRFFKHQTGQTPQMAIRERRIHEACIQLRYSAQTIDEIALATGFSDRYYFSRVFKKQRGIGPAEFRRITKEE